MLISSETKAYEEAEAMADLCGVSFFVHPCKGAFMVTDTPIVPLEKCRMARPKAENLDHARENQRSRWTMQRHARAVSGWF